MTDRQSGWWHPGPPPHVCDLPSPHDVPEEAKPYESTWTCPECGHVFTFTGTWDEQVGPDEFQPYTHWLGPETEQVPPWAVVQASR